MLEWVLFVWAVAAHGATLYFARESRIAQGVARVALQMAEDAVEAREEMERNTPVMVLLGPDGLPTPTAPMQCVRYWLN